MKLPRLLQWVVLGAALAGCPASPSPDASDDSGPVADTLSDEGADDGNDLDVEAFDVDIDDAQSPTCWPDANTDVPWLDDASIDDVDDASVGDLDAGDAESIDGVSGDAANLSCEQALPLRANVENFVESTARLSGACDAGPSPGFAYYSFSIPPRSFVDFQLRSTPSVPFSSVLAYDSCSARSCRFLNQTTASIRTVENNDLTPRNIYLALDRTTVSITPRVRFTAFNSRCETPAALLACNVPTPGDLAIGGASAGCARRALYYSILVPPESKGRVVIDSRGDRVGARLLTGCPAAMCGPDPVINPMLWVPNDSAEPRRFVVEIGGGAGFTITHASNEHIATSCAEPRAIALGSTVSAESSSAIALAPCARSDGRQLFYSVAVPPNTRANVVLTRVGANNVRARVLDSCDASSCELAAATSSAASVSIAVDNRVNRPVNRVIAVSAVSTPASFRLAYVGTTPLPLNRVCAAPEFFTSGMRRTVDTTIDGAPPIGCDDTEGLVLYYRVIVSGRSRLTVSLSRAGALDMRLRYLADCVSTTCINSVVTRGTTPASIELENTNPVMAGFLLAVGAAGGGGSTGVGTLSAGAETPL